MIDAVMNLSLVGARKGETIVWAHGTTFCKAALQKAKIVSKGTKWIEATGFDFSQLSIQTATGRIYDSRRKGGVQVGYAFRHITAAHQYERALECIEGILAQASELQQSRYAAAGMLPSFLPTEIQRSIQEMAKAANAYSARHCIEGK